MLEQEKLCQSSNFENISMSEHHQLYAELPNSQCAKKVQLKFDSRLSTVAKSCWLSEQTINYWPNERGKWIIFKWIILVSIISEYVKTNKLTMSPVKRNMVRFCNLNRFYSSSSFGFYILAVSFLLLINTSTIDSTKLFFYGEGLHEITTNHYPSAKNLIYENIHSFPLFKRPTRNAQYSNNYHHHQHQVIASGSSERIEPTFDTSTQRNVTTSAGRTVHLPCRVHNLGDRTVSWIRKKDRHVLTVGTFTYTSDQRFQTLHAHHTEDWTLQILMPTNQDNGLYECQVSSTPKKSLFVQLNVVVTRAEIEGGPNLYVYSGSAINLTCVVKQSSPIPLDYIFWYHNGKVINYESRRGVSVELHRTPNAARSILRMLSAQVTDSGNFSCEPSAAEPASVAVRVLSANAEPAAMQHERSGKRSAAPNLGNGVSNLTGVLNFCIVLIAGYFLFVGRVF